MGSIEDVDPEFVLVGSCDMDVELVPVDSPEAVDSEVVLVDSSNEVYSELVLVGACVVEDSETMLLDSWEDVLVGPS